MVYGFGAFELDTRTGELRKSGVSVKLGGQPSQLLSLLVERSGEVVVRAATSSELDERRRAELIERAERSLGT